MGGLYQTEPNIELWVNRIKQNQIKKANVTCKPKKKEEMKTKMNKLGFIENNTKAKMSTKPKISVNRKWGQQKMIVNRK